MEDPAAKYFSDKVTERDRAFFEAGIAMGMVVHQFAGIPIGDPEMVPLLEEVIRRALLSQPFRVGASVKIEWRGGQRRGPYDYSTLRARDMDVSVVVRYGRWEVRARLRRIEELDYNLAYVEDVREAGEGAGQGDVS
ncbi:MAG: dihydroneopterin aldolase family protein [Desulfurococcaceae archaeon]